MNVPKDLHLDTYRTAKNRCQSKSVQYCIYRDGYVFTLVILDTQSAVFPEVTTSPSNKRSHSPPHPTQACLMRDAIVPAICDN